MKRVVRAACAAIAATLALATPASAFSQAYPSKPLRIVVPYASGGGADVLARLVADKLSSSLGQTVIVENRPGAGGTIAAGAVAKSVADGYTILLADIAPNAIAPSLYAKLSYDPTKDFEPITQAVRVPLVIVSAVSAPFKNVSEMLTYGRANPHKLTYGTSGNGSIGHMAGEFLSIRGALPMQHVPYKGGSALIVDVVTGEVLVGFVSLASAWPLVQAGKLQVIGVTGKQRPVTLPNLQSVSDAGVSDYEVSTWFGFAAPAGTPRPIVDRLHREIRSALQAPDSQERLREQGFVFLGSSPDEFRAYIQSEIARWQEVARLAGIKPQ